jgi:hypothetical protein
VFVDHLIYSPTFIIKTLERDCKIFRYILIFPTGSTHAGLVAIDLSMAGDPVDPLPVSGPVPCIPTPDIV